MQPNLRFPADLVTFTEEIPNGELHLLCSACHWEMLGTPNYDPTR